MKKIILTLSLLFSIFGLYANDTYFFMAGGQLVPTKEGNVDVEKHNVKLILEEEKSR